MHLIHRLQIFEMARDETGRLVQVFLNLSLCSLTDPKFRRQNSTRMEGFGQASFTGGSIQWEEMEQK
ncbi:unnamed protein product [Angiostrongylus costaricensis]|uniref:Ovule protein n=1 Tax=Angiostrongylus costaricensis TaxID=334426 RepID=A0A0R3Q286_ANGCS|nr:unnamed protein product [Angiostrongylus costaricensis]